MQIKAIIFAISSGVIALNAALAAPAHSKSKTRAGAQSAPTRVNLYSDPDASSKVLEALKPNQNLVPIFHKGDWIKVGNPRDGKVGWINQKQYRSAYEAWYRPSVQTIFVRNDQDKEGKPVVNIIAYSNGKKLDEKQAKALYERMQQEQQQEMKNVHQLTHQMNHFFERENAMFERDFPGFMRADFAPPVMMRPVIVVNQPATSKEQKPGGTTAKK